MLPGRCTAGGWSWGFWSPEPWAAAWSGVPRLFPTAGCRGGRRMHHQCVRGVARANGRATQTSVLCVSGRAAHL